MMTFSVQDQKCGDCGHQHAGVEVGFICIGCPCDRRPGAPIKRYFACEEMNHVTDDTGISWWVVAENMAHAMRILGDLCLDSAVKFEIVEIDREKAAAVRAHEMDPPHPDNLADCPLGTALCSEY